jgi:hypothetical protein
MKNPGLDFREHISFKSAATYGCFNCCGQLDMATVEKTDYPQGRGQYRMKCADCGMSTWFDLMETPKQMEAQ